MNEDRFLAGRVAMVTGGASGMGRAMALAFARAGANVAIGSLLSGGALSKAPNGEGRRQDDPNVREKGEIVYRPGRAEMDAVAREIEAAGVKSLAMNLDVTSQESVQSFFDATVRSFGKIDILANAAGITAEQTMCGHSEALFSKVIEVNLHGTFRTIRLCLPGMMERGFGRIINIASTAASVGAPTSAAYCASKAAVVGLTRCVALEGAPRGVTCNAISPGWVETSFGKDWMGHIANEALGKTTGDYIQETKAGNPQKRMIQPQEIGALAAFLCREEALGITMQDLTVSAGSLW